MAEKIYTENAPAAIGPYSQAVKAGNVLYTSGQIAIVPASGNIEATDIQGQTTQGMENLKNVLAAAGTDFDHVVKTTCFLADIADNELVWGGFGVGENDGIVVVGRV